MAVRIRRYGAKRITQYGWSRAILLPRFALADVMSLILA
jgi:hypothetical protein